MTGCPSGEGLGPVTGVEPATSSLQVNPPGFTGFHSSPLTCGNTLNERYYDGHGTASTATELHRETKMQLVMLRVLSSWRKLCDAPSAITLLAPRFQHPTVYRSACYADERALTLG